MGRSSSSDFIKRGIQKCLIVTILWMVGATCGFASGPITSPGVDTIRGKIFASNGFAWNYGYDIRWDGHNVLVSTRIKLVPHAGVTPLDLDRIRPVWKAGIEEIWSHRYALKTPDGKSYPILIDVSFNGPRFHHRVVVRPGGDVSDELNWHMMNSLEMIAHEFGHMLGAFDEYCLGATDPSGKIVDVTSIMTSNPSNGKAYGRHYRKILDWFEKKYGIDHAELVSVDRDPGSIALSSTPCRKSE